VTTVAGAGAAIPAGHPRAGWWGTQRNRQLALIACFLLPSLVVLFALSLPGLVAGSIFVEAVFAWPGMGRLMVGAIAARDYPLVMGAAVVYSAVVLIANLAGDLALPLVDPRRRA
jgi:ABC-type dipeptide/oligopeptide/nickel transport system permease component